MHVFFSVHIQTKFRLAVMRRIPVALEWFDRLRPLQCDTSTDQEKYCEKYALHFGLSFFHVDLTIFLAFR